jgi:hypothetical protein
MSSKREVSFNQNEENSTKQKSKSKNAAQGGLASSGNSSSESDKSQEETDYELFIPSAYLPKQHSKSNLLKITLEEERLSIKSPLELRNAKKYKLDDYKQFNKKKQYQLLGSSNLIEDPLSIFKFIHFRKLFVVLVIVIILTQFFFYTSYVYNRSTKSPSVATFILRTQQHEQQRRHQQQQLKAKNTTDLEYSDIFNEGENSTLSSNNTSIMKKPKYYIEEIRRELNVRNQSMISLKQAANEQYELEFRAVKKAVKKVMHMENGTYGYCTDEVEQLEGELDVHEILENAGLDGLVEFYSGSRQQDKKISNKSNGSQHADFFKRFNLEALNVSASSYGLENEPIELGGSWRPSGCQATLKLAIIIPYRDRLIHLKIQTYILHLILRRQMVDYRIFVVEPTTPLNISFNKGRVMNAAYLEALKIDPTFDCFVFHDVDLITENDRNLLVTIFVCFFTNSLFTCCMFLS